MRFTGEKELMKDYSNRTRKQKTKFLWWPITIDGETRWLETDKILYKVKKGEDIFCNAYYYWVPVVFINK